MNNHVTRLLACVLLALVAGCSVVDTVQGMLGLGTPRTPLRTLSISADPDANGLSATQLDVVVIYDTSLIDRLPKTGPDWFHQRKALQDSLATGIEVVALEVPGATAAFNAPLPSRIAKGTAVIAYANYVQQAGWPAITLTPYRKATLRLTKDTVVMTGN